MQNLTELVRHAVYEHADLNAAIPDIDQIAQFLYSNVGLSTKSPYGSFLSDFLHRIGNFETLSQCFYPGLEVDLNGLFDDISNKAGDLLILCSWTQGNVFLQMAKARVFQALCKREYLANPCIYVAHEKISLLPQIVLDLRRQGCETVVIIDDRAANIKAAMQILSDRDDCMFLHKLRPDKPAHLQPRLPEYSGCVHLVEDWAQITTLLAAIRPQRIGIVLDKDGVIYNTTLYRELLVRDLPEWLFSKQQ